MTNNPKLLPFKGLRYNANKVSNLADVVTPPYDVINPEMQNEFYERHPYNFVKIDLNKEPGDKRYEEAGKLFKQWIDAGILVQDEKPAFYFHHQIFKLSDGHEITRKGFFGVRRIEDFSEGGIKPHEKTLEGPKADRLKLMRATQTQLSPVFSLYSDPQKNIDALVGKIKSEKPLIDFVTVEGERHQLWKAEEPSVCTKINSFLGEQPLFIADGHHRYETSLNYRNECRQKNPGAVNLEPFNYGIMYFSNMSDEGLIILPIHRALHSIKNFKFEALLEKLRPYCEITPLGETNPQKIVEKLAEAGKQAHAFVLLTKDSKQSCIISLKRQDWISSLVAKTVSESLRPLDVTVLHRLVFEEILGISQTAQANQENIIYWKDTKKAINETQKGACEITFLLNPTRIQDMERVAMAGEKMPQKSTYFYPKILSGLVMHPLWV